MEFSAEPSLCANGYGFYGSIETKNLCSKCNKDSLRQLPNLAELHNSEFIEKVSANSLAPVLQGEPSLLSAPSSPAKTAPSSCRKCNKKLLICSMFKCRCGETFCERDQYPECHDCSFNFKDLLRAKIPKENPLVKADKLHRI